MANFEYKGTIDGSTPNSRVFDVASGTTASISIGDLVVVADGYAAKVANGGGTTGGRYGLARSASTETTTAAGSVQVDFSPVGLVLQGVATTPGNLATAFKFDKVTIDVSGATQTVDENDTTNGGCTLWDFVGTDYTTTGKCQIVVAWNVY